MNKHLADVEELRDACKLPPEFYGAFKNRIVQRLCADDFTDKTLQVVAKSIDALSRLRADANKLLVQADYHGMPGPNLIAELPQVERKQPRLDDLISACANLQELNQIERIANRMSFDVQSSPSYVDCFEAAVSPVEVELLLELKSRALPCLPRTPCGVQLDQSAT